MPSYSHPTLHLNSYKDLSREGGEKLLMILTGYPDPDNIASSVCQLALGYRAMMIRTRCPLARNVKERESEE